MIDATAVVVARDREVQVAGVRAEHLRPKEVGFLDPKRSAS
jgi:hypothetical protein